MFDASTLPDITEQVQRLERNEKDGYQCRAPGCERTYVFHSGRVRYVNITVFSFPSCYIDHNTLLFNV